jgi:hypothetical protein
MTKYTLRNIDTELWLRVKERAAKEGRSLRFVLLEVLKIYAKYGFTIVETFDGRDKH